MLFRTTTAIHYDVAQAWVYHYCKTLSGSFRKVLS